jgi:hypothetical protein
MDKSNMAYVEHRVLLSHEEEITLFARKLVKLEIIMLIKTNQTQKGKYFVFSLI